MVPNDENVAVGGCSPFRFSASDGDAVYPIDEAPLRITVVKAYVGVWLQFGVRKSFAFENISQVWFATILSIVSCQPSSVAKFIFPLI